MLPFSLSIISVKIYDICKELEDLNGSPKLVTHMLKQRMMCADECYGLMN